MPAYILLKSLYLAALDIQIYTSEKTPVSIKERRQQYKTYLAQTAHTSLDVPP
jgi:hypothetical protein